MPTAEQNLRDAQAAHQQGRLADAMRLYRRVLALHPRNADVLHLLGVAALQSRQIAEGVDLIRKAIALNGTVAAMHTNLGNGLRDLGRPAEAVARHDDALSLDPNYALAWCNRGIALIDLSRAEEALASFDKALALRPDYPEAHSGRGNALMDRADNEGALASYDRAVAARPGFAAAWVNRGNALLVLARYGEALTSYDRAIALNSDLPDAHNGRGNALWELGRLDNSAAAYRHTIAVRPDHADAHSNLGNVLRDLKRPDEALTECDAAIALRADHAEAWFNRGNALADLKRREEALASYDRVTALKPDHARAHFNRGNVLLALARPAEALASFDAALAPPDRAGLSGASSNLEAAIAGHDKAIAPRLDAAAVLCSRANALAELGRIEEAFVEFDRSIALDPVYADAHWNKGLLFLQTGRLAEGWPLYEWRKKLKNPPVNRNYDRPLWLGEQDIAGKTLFVYWEQGFGDMIQFARYVKLAEARGAHVILEAQRVLHRVLRQLSPTFQILLPNQTPGPFDYHCPVMSLPLAFRTAAGSIPAWPSYLSAEPAQRRYWAGRLGPKTKPRIGLAWSGSGDHGHDHFRSLGLAACRPLLDLDADWVAVQKDLREPDRLELEASANLRFFGGDLTDFSDTAGLIDNLDLVVTVDTSAAHLAGAMGKPVWILLGAVSDWRWFLDRDDSPWYPSARLFRQTPAGGWAGPIEAVRAALIDALISNPATR